MKKVILIPIIVGSALLVTGGIILGVGIANSTKSSNKVVTEYAITEDFNNFNIDLDVSDLELVKTSDGTRKVVFNETDKEHHQYTVNEGTLNITFQDERQWYEKWFSFAKLKVTLYLPLEEYGEFKVQTDTGDTVVPNDFTFNSVSYVGHTGDLDLSSKVTNKLYVKLSTGKVKLTSMTAKEMELKASTGDINLTSVTVEETITTNLSTGKLTLVDVHAKNLHHESSTGDVKLTNTLMDEKIFIKTSTGDVKLVDSDAGELEIKTSTGDVTGSLLTNKIFIVYSETSKPSVPETTSGGICKITTDTGKIKITIKD